MKLNIQTLAALIIPLLLLSLIACGHRSDGDGAEQTPVIDVADVITDSVIVHKTYPGYLTAEDHVDLVARVNGYLRSIPYKEGDFVRAGQVLFTIESTQYADAVNEARSALKNAEASYRYASANYQAMQKALQSDAVSQMEVLQSKSAMEEAQAAIQQARAQLQTAQTQLSYCTVRAPFDGHVSKSLYSVGAFLAGAGAPVTLATIYHDGRLKANFAIDEEELSRLQNPAQSAALDIDMKHIPLVFDQPMKNQYTADLSYMAPAVDTQTGTMQIQAMVDNSQGELRSGMYCKIEMPSQNLDKAMLVRDASIGTDQLGKYVYLVNDSSKVVYTPIKVGQLVNDTLRIVTSGLRPGDRYVTKALLKVRDGMTVKPRLVK